MKQETILVANLKCHGCANTIRKNLSLLNGMKQVEVDHENGEVKIEYEDSLNRKTITDNLLKLGYPEATEENGLLTQLKSYASCVIGRIND